MNPGDTNLPRQLKRRSPGESPKHPTNNINEAAAKSGVLKLIFGAHVVDVRPTTLLGLETSYTHCCGSSTPDL